MFLLTGWNLSMQIISTLYVHFVPQEQRLYLTMSAPMKTRWMHYGYIWKNRILHTKLLICPMGMVFCFLRCNVNYASDVKSIHSITIIVHSNSSRSIASFVFSDVHNHVSTSPIVSFSSNAGSCMRTIIPSSVMSW